MLPVLLLREHWVANMSLDGECLSTETERLVLDKVGALDVRLAPNRSCVDTTHFLCWRIDCRHCGQTLVAHVGVERVRDQIDAVRVRHTC